MDTNLIIEDERLFDALREAMEKDEMDIQLSDNFREYEDWDSLAHLSMVAVLDEKFGIQIEGDTLENLLTVEDLLNEIKERTK